MDNVILQLKINGAAVTTNPVFGDDVKLKIEREDNQVFNRVGIDGSVKFIGADFDLIASCSNEAKFTLMVYRGTELVGQNTPFLGSFGFIKADCDLDYDDKVCSVRFKTTDRYEKILGAYDNTYNLVSLAPERNPITLSRRPVLQFYMLGDTKITNYIGNTAFEEDASAEAEDMDSTAVTANSFTNLYHYISVEAQGNEGWEQLTACFNGNYNQSGVGTQLENPEASAMFDAYYLKCTLESGQGGASYVWTFWYNDQPMKVNGDYPIFVSYNYSDAEDVVDVARSAELDIVYVVGNTRNVIGKAVFNNRKVFARMIHNYEGTISGQTTRRLADLSEDVANRNFNFIYASTVVGFGLESAIQASTKVQDSPTPYGINDEGKYYVAPPTGDNDSIMIPIAWNMWSPMSWWFKGSVAIYNNLTLYNKSYILKDAYPLWSAIQVLLAQVDSSITYNPNSTKHFFFGTASMEESDYIAAPRTRSSDLYITPITNVKKTFYEQAARKGDMTLKQIFDMLRDVFQVYWWVDDDNELRLEHITYFKHNHSYAQGFPTADIDVTAMTDRPNKLPWSFRTSEVTHERGNLPCRYEFSWADECTEPFKGYPIDIRDNSVDGKKVEKIKVANFLTDIDYVTILPDRVSDDIYMLIEAKTAEPRNVSIVNIRSSSERPIFSLLNGHLSYIFAARNYWPYDLGGWYAYMDGSSLNVRGTRQFIKQDINFPMTMAQVGTIGTIKSELGVGLVQKQEINADTLYAKTTMTLEGERDYSSYIGIFRDQTGTTVSLAVQNILTEALVLHYTIQTIGQPPVVSSLFVPRSVDWLEFASYNTSTQVFLILGVTKATTPVELGQFTRYAYGAYTMNVLEHTASSLKLRITAVGGSVNNWGYVCIRTSSGAQVKMTAAFSNADSHGYIGSEPILVSSEVSEQALAYVVGDETETYAAQAGSVLYLGLTGGIAGDNILFEITA